MQLFKSFNLALERSLAQLDEKIFPFPASSEITVDILMNVGTKFTFEFGISIWRRGNPVCLKMTVKVYLLERWHWVKWFQEAWTNLNSFPSKACPRAIRIRSAWRTVLQRKLWQTYSEQSTVIKLIPFPQKFTCHLVRVDPSTNRVVHVFPLQVSLAFMMNNFLGDDQEI